MKNKLLPISITLIIILSIWIYLLYKNASLDNFYYLNDLKNQKRKYNKLLDEYNIMSDECERWSESYRENIQYYMDENDSLKLEIILLFRENEELKEKLNQ